MKQIANRAIVLLLLLAAGGCSGNGRPATYQVSGTVTYKGQPLEGATVVFVPPPKAAYEAAMGVTDSAGKFKLSTFTSDDGAQEGDYKIKVSKFDIKKPTKEEQDKYISIVDEQKLTFDEEKPQPPPKNILPPKYASEESSGLTHSVKKGQNTVDLKLD